MFQIQVQTKQLKLVLLNLNLDQLNVWLIKSHFIKTLKVNSNSNPNQWHNLKFSKTNICASGLGSLLEAGRLEEEAGLGSAKPGSRLGFLAKTFLPNGHFSPLPIKGAFFYLLEVSLEAFSLHHL